MNAMRTRSLIIIAILSLAVLWAEAPVYAGGAARVPDAIWAGGELYDTIGTPTVFRTPPANSTDTLYNFGMSGLQGQRSVSESAPGDPDFNGGRWSIKIVVFTSAGHSLFDPDGDGIVNFEMVSQADVLQQASQGNLTIMDTDIYFECPLLPRRR
jgi:hypothetical protein